MNDRIQELAEEHGLVHWDNDNRIWALRGDVSDVYSFGELIVRECILRLEKISEDESYSNSDRCILEEARIALEAHFGVEQ